MTSEYPALMNPTMVRATRDGFKDQTRRLVKGVALDWLVADGFTPEFVAAPENRLSRYGYAGDRLWIRETWRTKKDFDDLPPSLVPVGSPIDYIADGEGPEDLAGKTRVSIHMPRWASRLVLPVVDVRIERLQDISEADVLGEGIRRWPMGFRVEVSGAPKHESLSFDEAVSAYRWLWNSINGPDSWDKNPFVWRIQFERKQ